MRATEETRLRDLLYHAAQWYGDNEAAVDKGQRLTYRQLLAKVRQMAAMYHHLGVRKGDRVAFLAYPSVNHTIAALGAFELGAIPAALHVRESAATQADTLKRISPRVLVYDGNFDALVDQLRMTVPAITGYIRTSSDITEPEKVAAGPDLIIPDDLERFDIAIEPMAAQPTDIAVIILSSGSTGKPKAVCHTNAALVHEAFTSASMFSLRSTDVTVSIGSTSFIAWYYTQLCAIVAGAKLIYLSRFDANEYLDVIASEHITIFGGMPTVIRMLMRSAQGTPKLDSARLIGFGGEAIDLPTLQQMRGLVGNNVMNSYGTTETCGSVTIMRGEEMAEGRLLSIGKPLPGYDIRIIRTGGTVDEVVEPGTVGEIIITGPTLARQMWDDPALERKVFEGKWWHSGDLGRMDADGYIYLEGRVDDMIISGGINVFPTHIEDVLLAHPGVGEVVVVGMPHEVWGQQIEAFVVRRDPTLTAEALDAYALTTNLAHYQRPRRYTFVDALPMTASGKKSRKQVRDEQTALRNAALQAKAAAEAAAQAVAQAQREAAMLDIAQQDTIAMIDLSQQDTIATLPQVRAIDTMQSYLPPVPTDGDGDGDEQ